MATKKFLLIAFENQAAVFHTCVDVDTENGMVSCSLTGEVYRMPNEEKITCIDRPNIEYHFLPMKDDYEPGIICSGGHIYEVDPKETDYQR